jgi:PHD/YefM family antitoxin component YafN of YafNO toxin-antitoxin module
MTESSFDKIKKLIKTIGGRVIIVEDGKPSVVITDIDEYINFQEAKNPVFNSNSPSKKESVGKINKDINIWKNRQEEKKINQLENNLKTEDLKNSFQNTQSENDKNDGKTNEIVIEKL